MNDGLKKAKLKIQEAKVHKHIRLDLSNLALEHIPEEIKDLNHLTELHLGNNSLKNIPDFIWTLSRLHYLNLYSNSISHISSNIGRLVHLSELYLNGNEILKLPKEIGYLKNLQRLYLFGNQLKKLPDTIGKLALLRHLSVGNNRLNYLPDSICNLVNLEVLSLHDNDLTTMPKEIGNLKRLKRLSLGNNNLSHITHTICNLPNILRLGLENNQIKKLPKQLFENQFDQILWSNPFDKGIDIDKNPLKSPPLEISKKGLADILEYFTNLDDLESTQLFEAKLLIVGQGGVGKTCLMTRIITGDIDPSVLSTEGIDINRWVTDTNISDTFNVNFWDFGGQEIYHATHQFFLTKRSLYLFVWESRTDVDLHNFDYWLNTIKLLSDNSPVIVIQNKIDERKKPINQEGWKKRFVNIVEYHDVSALKSLGIDTLIRAIKNELTALPHIGDVLPKKWIDIRAELDALNENYILYSHYQEICTNFGLDSDQADLLSEYYHDLGVFLHFKNNPILRNLIFLNPEWATNAVYKITDDPIVQENFGKFRFEDLQRIWSDHSEYPPDKHIHLLELMKSFELCFELPENQNYIIPELLRIEQPEFDWDFKDNLLFKYTYDFMPAGVITRFIVNIHDLILDDLFWREGVVLSWEDTKAVIIKSQSRKIEIRLNGSKKAELLDIIRREFEFIHRPFKNLIVDEFIPCICKVCYETLQLGDEDINPGFFSYPQVLKAQKHGVKELLCQSSFINVIIDDLLQGVESQFDERKNYDPVQLKIFLASSNELKDERREMELFVSRENRKLYHRNITLDFAIWEEMLHSFSKSRAQDVFNKSLLTSEIVVFLFHKKVGKYTKEEFELAFEGLKNKSNPRYLYVFFKSGQIDMSDINHQLFDILELRKTIEDSEQIFKEFNSKESLILQFKKQLDLILEEYLY